MLSFTYEDLVNEWAADMPNNPENLVRYWQCGEPEHVFQGIGLTPTPLAVTNKRNYELVFV